MEEIQRIGELEKIPEIVVSAGKTLEKTEKTKSRPFTVIVEGNIGSGKTTFLQVRWICNTYDFFLYER